jgi:hypothetical protein
MEEMERQEEDHLSRAGLVRGSDGSLRPLAAALKLEPELADHVQAIQERIDRRYAAALAAKEQADAEKAALDAEQKLKADRERARLGGDFSPPTCARSEETGVPYPCIRRLDLSRASRS